MIKKIFFITATIAMVACNSNKKTANSENEAVQDSTATASQATSASTDAMNTLIPDVEEEGSNILVGKANRKGLEQAPFNEWFTEGYTTYQPDPEVIEKLKPQLKDVSIKVFMGTWCEDSQREIPHLYKILDTTGFNENNFSLVTVTQAKDTPQGLEKGLEIDYVPTIILYRNGEEVGRFVEYAQETLEKDLLAIASGADYKHPYAE